jgi:pantothenate kinase
VSVPTLDPSAFAHRLAGLAARRGGRIVAALAGPPAAGKSHVAEAVARRLNAADGGLCVVAPMDGFHYDDAVLTARGLLTRKGAPETFDVGGLAALLTRLRANAEPEIALPLFDRSLEVSRAAARIAPREARIILVEGNWLLLDAEPWRSLRPLFDLTAMIAADADTLKRRLMDRWSALPPDVAGRKIEGNDLPNALRVMHESAAPDIWIGGGEG